METIIKRKFYRNSKKYYLYIYKKVRKLQLVAERMLYDRFLALGLERGVRLLSLLIAMLQPDNKEVAGKCIQFSYHGFEVKR